MHFVLFKQLQWHSFVLKNKPTSTQTTTYFFFFFNRVSILGYYFRAKGREWKQELTRSTWRQHLCTGREKEETHQPLHREERPEPTYQAEGMTHVSSSFWQQEGPSFHLFLLGLPERTKRGLFLHIKRAGLACLVRTFKENDWWWCLFEKKKVKWMKWVIDFSSFRGIKVLHFPRRCVWEEKEKRRKRRGRFDRRTRKETEERRVIRPEGRKKEMQKRYPLSIFEIQGKQSRGDFI